MAKKASLNKNKSLKSAKRSKIGKDSVNKGIKFENDVADLYRLLGAEVIQNIEILNKKVDIFATYRVPGSFREHKVIIECKDEKRAVDANQRVMAFAGLLKQARELDIAHSAEIITRTPWSDQAKGFAKNSGIELQTYTEKISKLIDFRHYLKDLINKFENREKPDEPALKEYYIDLSAEREIDNYKQPIPIIDDYIYRWLNDNESKKQLAIFGEYGSGKSSLCRKLAYELAKAYLKDALSSRIPILLNLRDFVGKVKIESFISSFLDQECNVMNPKFNLFKAMNDAGIFLIIFDGLDEMAVKVDSDTLESNLLEIDKLASSPNAKVLLTSRPEHFKNTEEEKKAINPEFDIFRRRATSFDVLKILSWNEPQINLFLQKRVPLIKGKNQPWTYYQEKINLIPNLLDLSQRPVLLEMIVKTLLVIVRKKIDINLASLYRTYISEEIKRQKIDKKRELLFGSESRISLLQKLAVRMFCNEMTALTYSTAFDLIGTEVKPPRDEQEAYTRDFLTNSFLFRRGSKYDFSHQSIQEHFIAEKIDDEITKSQPEIIMCNPINHVIVSFIEDINKERLSDERILEQKESQKYRNETLRKWINNTRDNLNFKGGYIGGNAATLLCRSSKSALAGADLSKTNLSGAILINADLRGASFQNTNLSQVRLEGAMFYKTDIEFAYISNTTFNFYFVKKIFIGSDKNPDIENEKSSYLNDLNLYIRLIKLELESNENLGYSIGIKAEYPVNGYSRIIITIRLSGGSRIESIQRILNNVLQTKVAFYYNEYCQLKNKCPDICEINSHGNLWIRGR